jgi:hypothetical protein
MVWEMERCRQRRWRQCEATMRAASCALSPSHDNYARPRPALSSPPSTSGMRPCSASRPPATKLPWYGGAGRPPAMSARENSAVGAAVREKSTEAAVARTWLCPEDAPPLLLSPTGPTRGCGGVCSREGETAEGRRARGGGEAGRRRLGCRDERDDERDCCI